MQDMLQVRIFLLTVVWELSKSRGNIMKHRDDIDKNLVFEKAVFDVSGMA